MGTRKASSPRKRMGGRSERVRCAALAAARELLKPGAPLPTMSAIAAKACVDRTSLYRRWGKVEALLHEAVNGTAYKGPAVPDTGSLRQDLMTLASDTHAFLSSKKQRHLVTMLFDLPTELKQEYWHKRYVDLEAIFERAFKRGEIKTRADWVPYIDLILAPWYFYHWAKGEPLPLKTLLHLVDMAYRVLTS